MLKQIILRAAATAIFLGILAVQIYADPPASPPTGKSGKKFTHLTLSFNAKVDRIIRRDLDNNGRPELLIQQGKKISIFSLNPAGTTCRLFSELTLADDVFLFDLADLTGDRIPELVILTPTGVSYFPFKDKTFRPPLVNLLTTKTIFDGTISGAPLFQNFAQDIDQDDDLDLIIPVPTGLALALQTGPISFTVVQKIPMTTDNRVQAEESLFVPLKTAIAWPLVRIIDMNGDQKNDLLIFRDNFVSVWSRQANGQFQPVPAQQNIDFALKRRRKKSDLIDPLRPLISDINKDNRPDIIISDGGEGVTGVFLNHAEVSSLFTPQKPDQIKRIKGWIINHHSTDLNNDGFRDLIIIQMHKVGVMGGLRLLLAHKVDWEIGVYINQGQPGKLYPDTPNYSRSIKVPFQASLSTSFLKIQTPYIFGFESDFNRDGLKDFLMKDGASNKLKIYFGQRKGVFNKKPDVSLTLSAPAHYQPDRMPYGRPIIADLDNNGQLDIIIHQQDFTGQNHFLDVFLGH